MPLPSRELQAVASRRASCFNDAMNTRGILPAVIAFLVTALPLHAVEPYKPVARTVPPPGIVLPAADRDRIAQGLASVKERMKGVDEPDIEMLVKAVDLALAFDEFYNPKDAAKADTLLQLANERLDALAKGEHPWATQHGNVVRGYRSEVDGSVQPYGLEIPENLDLSKPVPLYVWLHGRGDKVTDLHFLVDRLHGHAPISSFISDAIIVHPFGRQCIGYKSAGEVDVLDVIKSVKERYRIDDERIALTGFSMGGAGAWEVGAHYADHFCVVHCGAGFVEVQRFMNYDLANIPPIEQKMWGVYNIPGYVRNLFNTPTIAYSGEIDKQKLAADIMSEAFKAEGRELPHLIGPGMGHKYHPDTLKEVMAFVQDAVKKGRDEHPKEWHLQTQTLRYNRMGPFAAEALEHHWLDSRVDAHQVAGGQWALTTKNIAGVDVPADGASIVRCQIDAQPVEAPVAPGVDHATFWKRDGQWQPGVFDASPRKRPGQQGPIDDAFMDPFLLVTPTGRSDNALFEQWMNFELDHARTHWRAVFRGDMRTKNDADVTADDIKNYHLVLFGDEKSNKLIAQIAGKLPMKIVDGDRVNLMIYPNPLNPRKYVVLNSGPTFREADDLNNSLQNPKLGDWAGIDMTVSPDQKYPGKVIEAGVFDEHWQLVGPVK
ncbi:MAG: prolyl oligopeptidase family serine peptidase [Planctomycetes bacterium]|nr:prolyl oligopeptidase family serine peptidase [Planctomycetota bacterium]